MERYSTRESFLLGYGPQRSFANQHNSSPKSPNGDSDIDFNDVFGGPPRRASVQEMRNSFSEAADSSNLGGENDTVSIRRRWSGISEKPVFGDEVGTRRRYQNDEFFDDIFKGNESLSSSPRKHNRDPFCSSPGSRVLSPLPPRAEPFLSSSVPAQFSLPSKLIKGSDLPTFGSGTRNHQKNKDGASNGFSNYLYSTLSRVSSQADLAQDASNDDVSQQSTLREDLSLGSEELHNLSRTDKTEKSNVTRSDSTVSGPANGGQFHFSIYKWASKGVPLPMPFMKGNKSRPKDKFKLERSASTDGRLGCEGMNRELPMGTPQSNASPLHAAMSSKIKSSWMETDKGKCSVEGASRLNRVEPCQAVEEPVLTQTSVKDNPAKPIFQGSREVPKSESAPEKGLSGRAEEEIHVLKQKASNSETKTLHSLFSDNDSEQGYEESTKRNEFKESKSRGNKKSSAVFDVNDLAKKEDEKRNMSLHKEEDKSNLRRDNLGKNRLGGKVQEFVKIFSQEASSKPNSDVNSQNHNSRRQENGRLWRENEARITTNKPNDRMELPNVNKNHITEASITVDESNQPTEDQSPQTRTNKDKSMESSSTLKDLSDSTAESIPNGSEATLGVTDEFFYGKFMIKDLTQYVDNITQKIDNHEDLHAIDAKIRKWSSGKEGNIRSLLSTLQYVLWTGSGWKPVPLVDLIEGNAVKRQYQKALLCLHPDKLQQKGATSNQKHTAEKVFDILQEAWMHFSSLGGL
ncbi:hypothetical protein K2173_007552 [Erythroxylum novogranatense]|uniref:J domain-containing protein required for chloroplast accumulation response 1 n=1 Tax=Erythroxylum novogranatense TaxID=1862640 RepID=A0AAV8T6S4_9ROSI|nr:hypothetical protein K2173_007552 [Erythroxylum novogranatense]